jgi:hypothetical protein
MGRRAFEDEDEDDDEDDYYAPCVGAESKLNPRTCDIVRVYANSRFAQFRLLFDSRIDLSSRLFRWTHRRNLDSGYIANLFFGGPAIAGNPFLARSRFTGREPLLQTSRRNGRSRDAI